MQVGAKLYELRLAKNLSQGDIQKRTGLVRSYTSRVENGHIVPTVETLEKYASALEVPLYRLFTDEESVAKPKLPMSDDSWGIRGKDRDAFQALAKAFSRMDEQDRKLLLSMRRVWRGAEQSGSEPGALYLNPKETGLVWIKRPEYDAARLQFLK